VIAARAHYTAADLQAVEEECIAHARDLGLDPPEILYHLVPAETVYSVACRQVPGRYSHSDFGVQYERMKAAYDRGEGRIYEVIFNAEPAHAYLLEGNSFVAQVLVIAHCLGHGDMFRHNPYFAPTDKDFPARVRSAAGRIDRYYARHGRREVEDFITACQAFAPHAPLDRLGRTYTPAEPHFEPKPYDELFPEDVERRRQEVQRAREEHRRRFPAAPERDLLGFIAEHGHGLEDWQRDVISIVRAEQAYFAPQARTKVLNEAVAVWAHQNILQRLELDSEAFVEAQALNAQVACPHAHDLNPYNLGIELVREVEKIAAGDLEGLDDTERERFAGWAGKVDPARKVVEVAHSYNDVSALRELLTPRVCVRAQLRAGESPPHETVSREEFERIRDLLVAHHTTLGVPVVEIVDGDGRGRGELWLEHRHEGVGLDDEYALGTLRLLCGLWGKPAVVRSIAGEGDAARPVWYLAESPDAPAQKLFAEPPARRS
jgi:stage V sporulation protein R